MISAMPINLTGRGNVDEQPPTDPNPTTSPVTFALNAHYTIDTSWETGYQATVTIDNPTSALTNSWKVTFMLPEGQMINSLWNGQYVASGQTITVTNPNWGGSIPSEGSTSFGMIIYMSRPSQPGINQLQAVANGDPSAPLPLPGIPVLNPISFNPAISNSYTVSWGKVPYADSYELEQSTESTFTNPQVVFQGAAISKVMAGQDEGTYYYRVRATNASGSGLYSNVRSVTVRSDPTPPPVSSNNFIEGYCESWNTTIPVPTIVQMPVDLINISFANFTNTGSHSYVVGGVEADAAILASLVTGAHNVGKKVKLSIGGATYGLSGQLRTLEDAVGMALAAAQYVQQASLDGVDYDIEDYPAPNLQIAMIQNTRQLLGPNALISYTAKAPASTTFPYNQVIQSAHPYLTSISIMAYDYGPGYNYQQDVLSLIAMGVPASKIVVGLMPGYDDLHVMTSVSDISTAAEFVKQHGLAGIMFWDLNRDHSNQTGLGVDAATRTAWNVLH
jgi:hypothetical protein